MGAICVKFKRNKGRKISHGSRNCNGSSISRICNGTSPPFMTERQKTIVRDNWRVLKEHIANFGVITFVSMFESRPELKDIFYKFRGKELLELNQTGLLKMHALRVMATVDKCVSRLDEPKNLSKTLGDVGRSHKLNNVGPCQVKSILPHFLCAIKPYIEDNFSDETAEAWRKLFDLLIFYMSEGMNK